MPDPRVVSFRCLQASWGIAIDLTAQAVSGPPSPGDRPAGTSLWWRASAPLSEDGLRYVQRGLDRVAPQVAARTGGADVVVDVRSVSYVPTDYQPEAMEAVVMLWAAAEFGLAEPHIDVTFDDTVNRYHFRY
jgi:hypothetical protein